MTVMKLFIILRQEAAIRDKTILNLIMESCRFSKMKKYCVGEI